MTAERRRPLTLKDVSEASGVSEMTVSRVLRNRGDVSDKTRTRVLDAARALGYVPNKIAGALASQRVNLVAVIIPSMSNLVFPEVMMGISEVLDDTPLQPVVGLSHYRPEREEAVLYEMLSWRPSGVIRTSPSKPLDPAVWKAWPTPTPRTFEPSRWPLRARRSSHPNCSEPMSSASRR